MVETRSSDHASDDRPGQRMQRLRVGVTGLAAVVLMVMLATAIASGVRESAGDSGNGFAAPPVSATIAPSANTVDQASEPLAQLGAAPGGKADEPEPAVPAKR